MSSLRSELRVEDSRITAPLRDRVSDSGEMLVLGRLTPSDHKGNIRRAFLKRKWIRLTYLPPPFQPPQGPLGVDYRQPTYDALGSARRASVIMWVVVAHLAHYAAFAWALPFGFYQSTNWLPNFGPSSVRNN